MILCLADLHISHKSDRVFEASRLEALALHLEVHKGANYSLALLGDTFDSNSPSLEDIKAFYKLIDTCSKIFTKIEVIAGNHDYKVLEYLPRINFTYYNKPTIVGDITFLPWTHLESHTSNLIISKQKLGKLLLSHARCTIVPHILEEVNIEAMSSSYNTVILGDIHMPYNPYPNVYYTSEPTQRSYKTYSKKSTGYIIIHEDYRIERVFTELPYKCKLHECTYDALDKLLPTLSVDNRYKIIVKDHVTNLQKLRKLKFPYIKFEAVPILLQDDTDHGEALKDMVSGKISIEQLLFDFVAENYQFDPTIASKILKGIR